MGILQEKKIPVIIALIIMILGSITYFTTNIPGAEVMKNGAVSDVKSRNDASQIIYDDASSNNPNIPMIENKAII